MHADDSTTPCSHVCVCVRACVCFVVLQYRGDALEAASNAAKRILPRTEPALQMDSGNSDSYLAYLVPPGTSAPEPVSKELRVRELGAGLVAVGICRGFGSDRGRCVTCAVGAAHGCAHVS